MCKLQWKLLKLNYPKKTNFFTTKMIGNDIVDWALSKTESNWQRKGFLAKIFTQEEQLYIKNAANSEQMVWNLWTRKEAAYKIYNRETCFRGYIPLRLQCVCENENSGMVTCDGYTYYTQTQISKESIYTIAVTKKEYFNKIISVDRKTKIFKNKGVPYLIDDVNFNCKPVSITHHGQLWKGVTLSL